MRRSAVLTGLLISLTIAGCGGAGLVLKQPISKACDKAGLRGCEPLSEGVILYIEGDKPTAMKRLERAAADNSPEKLRAFANALLALEKIPGASSFAGPIVEVAKFLAAGSPVDTNTESSAGHGAASVASKSPDIKRPIDKEYPWSPSSNGAPSARAATVHALTADSDPSRLAGGMLRPASNQTSHPCVSLAPEGWRCFELARGPFVVTDLRSAGTCKVFAGVASPSDKLDSLRWVLHAPFDVHGSRLAAGEGERLFIAVEGVVVRDEKNPYKVFDTKGPECSVLWAGFYPFQEGAQGRTTAPAQAESMDGIVSNPFAD